MRPTTVDPANANEDVRRLLLGTIPERVQEINVLVESIDYRWASDRPALHFEALAILGAGVVTFTQRAMLQMWLIGYLAWQMLREQSGFVIEFWRQGGRYDVAETVADASSDAFMAKVDQLSTALRAVQHGSADSYSWPSDVPRLDSTLSELKRAEDKVAWELTCFATAFVLLHETHHATKRASGYEYTDVDEEFECDRYAIGMLLGEIDECADQQGFDLRLLKRKRAMGVFLGQIVILESSDVSESTPSDTHPHIYERILATISELESLGLSRNDDFWVFASCALISKLRRENRLSTDIVFDSPRTLFLKSLEMFNPATAVNL